MIYFTYLSSSSGTCQKPETVSFFKEKLQIFLGFVTLSCLMLQPTRCLKKKCRKLGTLVAHLTNYIPWLFWMGQQQIHLEVWVFVYVSVKTIISLSNWVVVEVQIPELNCWLFGPYCMYQKKLGFPTYMFLETRQSL